MVIDKETSKNLQIKHFLINDKKFNVEVEEKGNTIEIKSRISEGIDKEIELNAPSDMKIQQMKDIMLQKMIKKFLCRT